MVFLQVPAHAELMWILSCTASMGYLSRMTQWKVGKSASLLDSLLTILQSKLQLAPDTSPLSAGSRSRLKLGLFSYPVLQAADILVHRCDPYTHYVIFFLRLTPIEQHMFLLAKTRASIWNSLENVLQISTILMVVILSLPQPLHVRYGHEYFVLTETNRAHSYCKTRHVSPRAPFKNVKVAP
jgi:hypothetical protein